MNEEIKTYIDDRIEGLSEKIDASIEKRVRHIKSSPETKDLFRDVQLNCLTTRNTCNVAQQKMRDDLTNLSKSFEKFVAKDKEWKDKMLSSLERKYSRKWVEYTVAAVITSLALSSVYIILNHVGLEMFA